jgi:hypothetical protein
MKAIRQISNDLKRLICLTVFNPSAHKNIIQTKYREPYTGKSKLKICLL